MASANKFQDFVEQLGLAIHNLHTATFNVYLTDATPSASADAVKADLAELATGGGYTGPLDTVNTWSETPGTGSMAAGTDPVWTGTTGFGPFRYVVLYNDTATGDPLCIWWDYGSSISVGAAETFTVDFGTNILQIV